MAGESTQKSLVAYYDIQHYLSFDAETTWVRITEDRSLEPNRETSDYATRYLDRKHQATYALGMKDEISFEVDAVGPDGIQKYLAKYEDEQNVPVVYMRTIGYDFEAGAVAPATARVAKKAAGLLNQSPITEEVDNPGVFHGTVSITEEYVKGTFNETTSKFTAADGAEG